MSDAMEILNFTDEPATFNVYAADVVPTTGGSLAPAARAAEITGPASWIKVDRATVEVPPRSSTTVPFTVSIPNGTRLGNHTAALLVEPQGPTGPGTIATKTRIGLWVKVKVTETQGEVLGDTLTPWGYLWILVILMGLTLVAWLTYVTRDRRQQWVQERREERALVRDLRNRRRHRETTTDHR